MQKDYPVDARATNGGGFTYPLWPARPEVFAAFAAKFSPELTPKSAWICGGKQDPIVRFEWQELEVDTLQKINGCDTQGTP